MKTFGKAIKKSAGIFSRNKNTMKNFAFGIQEKYLKTGLNFGSKSAKFLGGQTIKNLKYTVPKAVTKGNQLFRASSKKSI